MQSRDGSTGKKPAKRELILEGVYSSADEVRMAFEELGLRSVNASVMAPNVASARVLERCGFRPAGRLRKGLRLDEEFVDRIVYDLLPEDVADGRAGAERA